MKRVLIALLIVALAAFSVSAATAFQEVKASILKYEPTPAEQGRTVDVWVQFSNEGQKATNVQLRLEPEYPFSVPPGQPEQVDVGFITATEAKVEKYTVYVDPNAPNGEHLIRFWYRFGASDDWIELEAPITVQTSDAVLVIDKYEVSPTPVTPGQPATVSMTLRNAGRTGVKNLDVSLNLEEEFSTIGTGTKQRVDFIGPGESQVVSFNLASDTSTEVKLYALPVELSYADERGNSYEDTAKVSLIVNAEPELTLNVDSMDFKSKTVPGTVSLQVINRGVVDTKFMTVRLVKTDEYDILSPSNEEYVGNLDSDDFESVDFIIEPLVKSPRLRVILEFKDPYNVDYQQEYDLPLRIITDEDLGKSRTPWGLLFLVAVAIAGFFWWKKRKAKKRK